MCRLVFVLLLAAALCAAQNHGEGAQTPGVSIGKVNPVAGQKAAIESGITRFKQSCAACHGPEAEGGRGPNLAENPDIQNMPDDQLFRIIENGIPGTSMPPSNLPEQNAWEIAAFLRSSNSPASLAPPVGDAAAGKAVFYGAARCDRCHVIHGAGGLSGPDLTNVGAHLTMRQLRRSILDPDSVPHLGYEPVTITLKNGKQLTGIAKNNSNYSVQLLDDAGQLRSVAKSDISELVLHRKSLMPRDYQRTLGPDGLNNVIAFLAQQTVRPPARPAGQAAGAH